MSYQPWKGKLEDGTEVLVSIHSATMNGDVSLDARFDVIDFVEVAFRSHRQHTWGPPVTLERAP